MTLLPDECSCLGHWQAPSSWCPCSNYTHRGDRRQQVVITTLSDKGFTRSIFNRDENNRVKGNFKVLSGLTHPPSSYRRRFPLHRVVCYLGSPRDNRQKQWHFRLIDLWHYSSHSFLLLMWSTLFSSSFPFPLTRLSLCSLLVQASMKVWAMTESEASTTSDTWTSKMKWGFLRMFTQNRRGRLHGEKRARKRLVVVIASECGKISSIESGRHFMCKSTCLRCNWVQHKIITGMEKSLSCRCQFIQNNTLHCHFILLFHMTLTSVRIIAVQWK